MNHNPFEKFDKEDAETAKRLAEELTIAMVKFAQFNHPKKKVLIATCEMIAEVIAQEFPQYINNAEG